MPSRQESDDPSSARSSSSPAPDRKRKRADPAHAELEVDVEAPEPPSKKAQRRAKKGKPAKSEGAATQEEATGPEAPVAGAGDETPTRSEFGIWIGNLPWSADKEALRGFLVEQAGVAAEDVTRIHMPGPKGDAAKKAGRVTFHNRGFAYVDFGSLAAQQAAIGISETLMGGSRRVLVKDARSFAGRPAPEVVSKDDDKPVSKRVFVGNLGWDADAAALRQHFSQCGPVADAFVATFEDSGKCKGYAWVTFEDTDGSAAAVRGFITKEEPGEGDTEPKKRKWWVNQLEGRRMRVEFAEDASVRYKKRFGKDKPEATEQEQEDTAAGGDEADRAQRPDKRDGAWKAERKRDPRTIRPGAALAKAMSERRNTGAIVEAKGKKITFD